MRERRPQCGSVPIAGTKLESHIWHLSTASERISFKQEVIKKQSLRSHVSGFHQELQCLHKLFRPFHLSSFSFSYLDSQHRVAGRKTSSTTDAATLVVYQLNEP